MTRVAVLALSVGLLSLACGEPSAPLDAGSDAGMVPPPRPDAGPIVRPDHGPPLERFRGLPVSCWLPPGSECNPANNDGCAADEACDLAVDELNRPIVVCFPPPATELLGAFCNNRNGPFCAGGLRCMDGVCLDTCCTDSECTVDGERCVALEPDLGTLGVCRVDDGPPCGGPGASCREAGDCCSRDCHIGHCH